jgi:hypothetical protein
LLTASQRGRLRSLRRALRRNNEANSDPATAQRLGDRFLEDGRIPEFDAAAMTARRFQALRQASQPAVIRGVRCTNHTWTLDFINASAGRDVVGVETSKSNRFYANEGLRKVNMTVAQFLQKFRDPSRETDLYLAEEELDEMPGLRDDVLEPDFSDHLTLDKLQVWVGAGGQVSPLHQDQWENILCQLQGERRLVLFDPLEIENLYPKSGANRHFSFVDPAQPDLQKFPRFRRAVRYEVTLRAGESFFLPAMWWHQVHHANTTNVAVNFWYLPQLLSDLIVDELLPP